MTEQLKAAREEAGLSQLQVAKKLDTAQTYIGSIENGYGNPSAQLLAQLARLYKVPASTFLPDKVVRKSPKQTRRVAKSSEVD